MSATLKTDGYTVRDIWLASVFSYLGYELAACHQIENSNRWTFTYVCPSEDGKVIESDYENQVLALASAKAFVNSFNILAKFQKDLKTKGEIEWVGDAWISGRVK